jgi:hypothetical protein
VRRQRPNSCPLKDDQASGEHTYEPVLHQTQVEPVEMEVSPTEMEGSRMYAELSAERKLPNATDLDDRPEIIKYR